VKPDSDANTQGAIGQGMARLHDLGGH
jgi:hypothetical protein